MAQNEQIIKEVEQRVRAAMKSLPRLVGNEVVNFAKDNFRRQGFLGPSFEPWPKRKTVTKWGKTPRNNGRALLIDTGALRRGTRVVQADWNEVKVGNAVPYAKAHNEGARVKVVQTVRQHRRKRKDKNGFGAIAGKVNKRGTAQKVKFGQTSSGVSFVKEHKRTVQMRLTKRKFLGNSPYLTRNIHRLIAHQITKAIK